jgi:hypothetical protein
LTPETGGLDRHAIARPTASRYLEYMPFTCHVLVVANRTVDSPELLGAIRERAERGPVAVTLLAPCTWSEREATQERVDAAIGWLAEAGVRADGLLGDADPIVAVQEAWDPARYDEVIVSTLSAPQSTWVQIDLPHRVSKLTDCPVRHVIAQPPAPPRPAATRAQPRRRGPVEAALSLLQVRGASRGL